MPLFHSGCDKNQKAPADPEIIPVLGYALVKSRPHDTLSFTEGLLIRNGILYESTGSFPQFPSLRSVFGPVDSVTGKIDVKVELDKEIYCGEGICYLKGKYYQLTYQNRVGFAYHAETYVKIGEFNLPGSEGWGLTTDGKSLIMSDGTDKLTCLDPETFLVTRIINVTENGIAKRYLNELEFFRGYIYANVWLTNTIVKIDPASGVVKGILDLTTLVQKAESAFPGSMEMNGIAYDSISGNVRITGKFWPEIYEIRLTGNGE